MESRTISLARFWDDHVSRGCLGRGWPQQWDNPPLEIPSFPKFFHSVLGREILKQEMLPHLFLPEVGFEKMIWRGWNGFGTT